jgi:hypothetical protein
MLSRFWPVCPVVVTRQFQTAGERDEDFHARPLCVILSEKVTLTVAPPAGLEEPETLSALWRCGSECAMIAGVCRS